MGSEIEPSSAPMRHRFEGRGPRVANEKAALTAFDAYFLGEMLKQGAPRNPTGLLDGGQAGRMYQDHLHEELARMMAESGEFGIARSLEGKLAPAAVPRERNPGSPVEGGEERR